MLLFMKNGLRLPSPADGGEGQLVKCEMLYSFKCTFSWVAYRMAVCGWRPDRWLPRDRRRNPPPDDCSGCAMFGGVGVVPKYLCLEFPRAWILEEVVWIYLGAKNGIKD